MIKVTSQLVPTTKEGILVEAKYIGGTLLGEKLTQDEINQRLLEMCCSCDIGKLTEITTSVETITNAISWEEVD